MRMPAGTLGFLREVGFSNAIIELTLELRIRQMGPIRYFLECFLLGGVELPFK